MSESTDTPVVTVFLRHRGDVLLFRRSEKVDSYPGQWGAVAGHVENDDPRASALAEIEEETGLSDRDVTLVREGPSFPVEDEERETRWTVHPFLFDASTREVDTNWETAEAEWTAPTVLRRRDMVPQLWTSYRRVAPSIVEITNDTTHGSAYLSRRALEVLRDRAGLLATTDAPDIEDARARLIETAHRLLEARPSMAALANRIHRVMHASQPELTPATVEVNAHEAIGHAVKAGAETARRAAEEMADQHVLTLSRSGTVLDALRRANPAPSVVVATSDPGGEGTAVAETLANADLDVTLIPDAAIATRLANDPIDAVLVGADTVRPSGAVINKVGTLGAALAAHRANVPFYAACAVDKVAVDDETSTTEEADPGTVYGGPAPLSVSAPRYDETPSDLVTGGIITDRGLQAPDAIVAVADELERLRAWM
jgi:translation initiation factor 2B subunit (eIF-2B alpha/beta/delta family)/8-oxo-dGTP pyrophosphatase MutT (NUDIX family)